MPKVNIQILPNITDDGMNATIIFSSGSGNTVSVYVNPYSFKQLRNQLDSETLPEKIVFEFYGNKIEMTPEKDVVADLQKKLKFIC